MSVGKPLDWVRHIVHPFREKAIAGLIEQGYDEADARHMVGKIGDGTILNWIITHGPEIMAFIQMIIALFPKTPAPEPAPA